ncbi:MAG TPA: hypothetical protein VLY45_01620 [Nitrospiria bacterium]|nr:hypothetical protein [Nitrospiria bacterium]
MNDVEPNEKWRANMEMVAFARHFPGLLRDWREAKGKRILSTLPLSAADSASGGGAGGGRAGQVILFDDRTFLVAGSPDPEPADLLNGLRAAESPLREWYPDAFAKLDELRERDQRLTQQARVEKIAGAIRHNAGLPGLKEAVTRALRDVSSSDGAKANGE